MAQEQTLQTSAILINQDNTWEKKIISKNDFNNMVQEYVSSLNDKFREKAFIDKETYNDIITLLSSNDDKTLHDAKWRNWARNSFVLELVGTNYIVCKIPSKRTKDAVANKQSEATSLPILIKERMWHEFCNAHVQLAHAGVSNTYNKLKIKWENIKQDLVARFVSKCITCALHKSSKAKKIEGKPIIARSFLSRVQVIIISYLYS